MISLRWNSSSDDRKSKHCTDMIVATCVCLANIPLWSVLAIGNLVPKHPMDIKWLINWLKPQILGSHYSIAEHYHLGAIQKWPVIWRPRKASVNSLNRWEFKRITVAYPSCSIYAFFTSVLKWNIFKSKLIITDQTCCWRWKQFEINSRSDHSMHHNAEQPI